MKTTNAMRGNRMRMIAIVAVIMLVSYTASAQMSYLASIETISTRQLMIRQIVPGDNALTLVLIDSEKLGRDFVIGIEKEINLESWMMKDDSWTGSYLFVPAEKDLALEAWMTQTFKMTDRLLEEDLNFEEWMIGDGEWFAKN